MARSKYAVTVAKSFTDVDPSKAEIMKRIRQTGEIARNSILHDMVLTDSAMTPLQRRKPSGRTVQHAIGELIKEGCIILDSSQGTDIYRVTEKGKAYAFEPVIKLSDVAKVLWSYDYLNVNQIEAIMQDLKIRSLLGGERSYP